MDQAASQSTLEILESAAQEQPESVATEAVTEKNDAPNEDVIQTGEDTQTEAAPAEQAFAELVIGDSKVAIKSKDEFSEFLEKNPMLKEGFMRMADYTRKTQELAKERDTLAKTDIFNSLPQGMEKPNQYSQAVLKSIWEQFQMGEPTVTKTLQDLASYVSTQRPQAPAIPPEVFQIKNDVDSVKSEIAEWKKYQAEQQWGSWKSAKELATRSKITPEVEDLMAYALERGKAQTLDEAFDWYMKNTGRKDAFKQVFTESKNLQKKTPRPPSSASASSAKPVPRDTFEILKQGLDES